MRMESALLVEIVPREVQPDRPQEQYSTKTLILELSSEHVVARRHLRTSFVEKSPILGTARKKS